ncbi:MAG: DUF6503 family protein [Bacteroidota bacterium]
MKKVIFSTVFVFLVSCGEHPKTQASEEQEVEQKEESVKVFSRNMELAKVLEAHGGIEHWKRMGTLVFEIPKGEEPEKHTIDLHSRKDKIEMGQVALGFDGKDVWIKDKEEIYQGDPAFYHNLMFYFQAMPFVLADPGIRYGKTSDLVFEGKTYPGISVRYDEGVGTSYKDEYFLHYDPNTYRMAWLGYTVTYGSNKKSDDVRWIRYTDWVNEQGLLLPKSLTWHAYANSEIGPPKNTLLFEGISLGEAPRPASFYQIPDGGKTLVTMEEN